MACTNIDTISKRLTSFDNKLTTLPGAVSPNAVCDKRNACVVCKKNKKNIMQLLNY